jgi:hypothetical protein
VAGAAARRSRSQGAGGPRPAAGARAGVYTAGGARGRAAPGGDGTGDGRRRARRARGRRRLGAAPTGATTSTLRSSVRHSGQGPRARPGGAASGSRRRPQITGAGPDQKMREDDFIDSRYCVSTPLSRDSAMRPVRAVSRMPGGGWGWGSGWAGPGGVCEEGCCSRSGGAAGPRGPAGRSARGPAGRSAHCQLRLPQSRRMHPP